MKNSSRIESGKGRLMYLDIARGISMLCIILGHLGNSNINRVVFTFHITIFFLITGFFISEKTECGVFIKSKFRTLIIPYYITCFIIVVIATIRGSIYGGKVGALYAMKEWVYASLYGSGGSYKEPFYIKAIGAIWFLWATFWGSILLKVSLKMKEWHRILFIICLFFAGYYSRKWFWFPLSIQAGCCSALFMYLGFCARKIKPVWNTLENELKMVFLIFALFVWVFFIKDFKSFWLVQCDVGRGIVDIFGSLCACFVVVAICKVINKVPILNKSLAYIGRYSIFMLCIHIVELNLYPWDLFAGKLCEYGMPDSLRTLSIIIGKFVLDISVTFLASRSLVVKKMFGIADRV